MQQHQSLRAWLVGIEVHGHGGSAGVERHNDAGRDCVSGQGRPVRRGVGGNAAIDECSVIILGVKHLESSVRLQFGQFVAQVDERSHVIELRVGIGVLRGHGGGVR